MNILGGSLQGLFSIIVVNLVLSGDNAIVIGMASRNLGDKNRRRAIFWGGAIAVVLRIVFTVIAALLLDVPLIHAIGGLLLVAISYQLIRPSAEGSGSSISAAESLRGAVRTILIADIVMSLDNILAVGGAAEGHLGLLIVGLAFSIPLVLFGSNVIAKLMGHYPWLLILGVGVLLHSAVSMFVEDQWVNDHLHMQLTGWLEMAITPLLTVLLVGVVWALHRGIAGFGEDAHQEGPIAGALS